MSKKRKAEIEERRAFEARMLDAMFEDMKRRDFTFTSLPTVITSVPFAGKLVTAPGQMVYGEPVFATKERAPDA
jgi:hypothetical protein